MTLSYLVLIAVLGLVTYRLTRLAVDDEFPPILAVRNAVMRFAYPSVELKNHVIQTTREAIGDLLSCRYCASGWVSLGVTLATWHWLPGGVPTPPLTWFAVWAVGVLIYNREEPAEPQDVKSRQGTLTVDPTTEHFGLKAVAEQHFGDLNP